MKASSVLLQSCKLDNAKEGSNSETFRSDNRIVHKTRLAPNNPYDSNK